MLLTIWLDARKQEPCKMCNKDHLLMTILLHKYKIQNLPGGEALMLEPFTTLLVLIPGGASLAVKLPMICHAADFPSCQKPRCQATQLPKYSMTNPSCQVIKLSNLQSCRAPELPSCRSIELPSCRNATLPRCRAAIYRKYPCRLYNVNRNANNKFAYKLAIAIDRGCRK